MSYICDWCGEEIQEGGYGAMIALGVRLHFHEDYHGDDDSCVLQALRLLDSRCATSRPVPPREQRARDRAAMEESQKVWGRLPRERRETLLLHVLGDEQLIIREVTDRMNRELGCPQRKNEWKPTAVYPGNVTALIKRLWRGGQLERLPETFNKTHTRYRYFRSRVLDGPIADLERAYEDDSEAVA